MVERLVARKSEPRAIDINQEVQDEVWLAVDFGNSYTCAYVWTRSSDSIQKLQLDGNKMHMPSVAYIEDSEDKDALNLARQMSLAFGKKAMNKVTVGSEAIKKESQEPHKFIFDTKLDLVERAEQEKKRQEKQKFEEEEQKGLEEF